MKTKTIEELLTRFEDQPVRTMTINDELWFVGVDVCLCLSIVNSRDALGRLADDERREIDLNTVGTTDGIRGPGNPNAIAINEPGVYRLIFESRKPEAERGACQAPPLTDRGTPPGQGTVSCPFRHTGPLGCGISPVSGSPTGTRHTRAARVHTHS